MMDRTIKITNAKISDSGQWICIARNSAGESRKTFDLSILGNRSLEVNLLFNAMTYRSTSFLGPEQHELLDCDWTAFAAGLLRDGHSKTEPRLDKGERGKGGKDYE